MTPIKLIILDRDGTINQNSDEYIKSVDEWVPLPGAFEAIAKLNHAGWHVVLASNQSGLGRGLSAVTDLNEIHTKMHQQLAAVGGRIDAVFFCPHLPNEGCHCRKPASGLFEQIADRFGIDLKGVPVVGDSARDLIAGANVGCEPHLVCTGNTVLRPGDALPPEFPAGTHVHADLGAFADHWIGREKQAG